MDSHLPVPLLLDGACTTNMVLSGMPMDACTESWILEHPSVIENLHKKFVNAGSMVITAPTFGANSAMLMKNGVDTDVAELNIRLLELTRRAVSSEIMVAGSMSSTGLIPSPIGDTPFLSILEVYREQASALAKAGADLIICESLTNMSDSRAAVIAASETGLPVIASMSLGDSGESPHGMPFVNFFITMQALGASAVGVNCFTDISSTCELIKTVKGLARIPIVAMPAAGLPGLSISPEQLALNCRELLAAGADIIGGCCGSMPDHINELRKIIYNYKNRIEPKDIIAVCSADEVFYINGDDFVLSDEILCRYGLEEDLIELENQMVTAALIRVEQPEDAIVLSEFSYKTHIPIMIKSDNPDALSECLLLYQGRAIVDRECEIDREKLTKIAEKYGALIH